MSSEETSLPLKLKNAITSIAKRENFNNYTIKIKIPDSISYLAVLREVTITGDTDKGHKEIHLFIKTIKDGENLSIYSLSESYVKEAFVYNDLLKVFHELQEEANIPLAERFKTPKAYEETDSQSIILENLAINGYHVTDRMKCIPLKFAELAIQQLAKFHGLAIALSKKRPKYFEDKVKTLKQPFYYGGAFNDFVNNINKLGMSCLDPDVREKVEKYLPTTNDKYAKYTTDPNSLRYLVHGDFRANNVMFKCDKGEISDVVVIDFQLNFYGCPIIDLIYFIFGATDQEFRRLHMNDLKNLYYSSLTKYLQYFAIDVEAYYPRSEFERLFKERLDYGLMFALWFIPMTHANEGELPDLTQASLNDLTFNLNDVIRSRVRGVVDDFINWGYL